MNTKTLSRNAASILAAGALLLPALAHADDDWRTRREAPPAVAPEADTAQPQRVVPVPDPVGPQRVVPVPRGSVDIQVWTDRGHGATYCAGEEIEIYFATNVDAWVTLYDIDTRGRVQVLFPTHGGDGYVQAGRTHRVSAGWGYTLAVTGPEGWEHLRAVAVAADRYGYGYDDRDDRYRDRRDRNRPYAQPQGGQAGPELDLRHDGWDDRWNGQSGVAPDQFDRQLEKRVVIVPRERRDVDQVSFYVETGRRCGYRYGGYGAWGRRGW